MTIGAAGCCVQLTLPTALAGQLLSYFALTEADAEPLAELELREVSAGTFSVLVGGRPTRENLSGGDVVVGVLEALQNCFREWAQPFLPAGLAIWQRLGTLVVGETQDVADLTAWLVEQGFGYATQRFVIPHGRGHAVTGLPGPVEVGLNEIEAEEDWHRFLSCRAILGSETLVAAPDPAWVSGSARCDIGLIILAEHVPDADLFVGPASPREVLASLGRANEPGRKWLAHRLRSVPQLRIRYGSLSQMRDVVDTVLRLVLERGLSQDNVVRLAGAFATKPAQPETRTAPARTERQLSPKMTIGMATYDDYDGVYFSIQSIRLHHPEILDKVEFLVLDNNPTGVCASHLKALEAHIPNYRYIPLVERTGTAVRDQLFAEAYGDYVLCMDCHVLFPPGALQALLDYFEANPETRDLIQGPILWDNLREVSSHWEPIWSEGMLGTWENNPLANDVTAAPFDIPLQGLGVFACRRAAWPGFNRGFEGFGGEEGYLHEKFRQAGARTLCLPALRWLHRFARPLGVPYTITWEHRIRNYVLGRQELGLPVDDVISHMTDYVGAPLTSRVLEGMKARGEWIP